MKNIKKTGIVLGAIATMILLISSVTAVSTAASVPTLSTATRIKVIDQPKTLSEDEKISESFQNFIENLEQRTINLDGVDSFEDLYKNKAFIDFMNSPKMVQLLKGKIFQDFYKSEQIQNFINSPEFKKFCNNEVIQNFWENMTLLQWIGLAAAGFAGLIFGGLTWIIGGPVYAVYGVIDHILMGAEHAIDYFMYCFEHLDSYLNKGLIRGALEFVSDALGALVMFLSYLREALDPGFFLTGVLIYPFVCLIYAMIIYVEVFVLEEGDSSSDMMLAVTCKSFA